MNGGEWNCYRELRRKEDEEENDNWDYFYVAPEGSKHINKHQPPAKKHVFRLVSYYHVLVGYFMNETHLAFQYLPTRFLALYSKFYY